MRLPRYMVQCGLQYKVMWPAPATATEPAQHFYTVLTFNATICLAWQKTFVERVLPLDERATIVRWLKGGRLQDAAG